MPNLDGVSATHLIRQNNNTTPIIAMTSNIRSDDISMYFQHGSYLLTRKCRSADVHPGMNDVLPKPFTKEGLLSMLEKHLGHMKKFPPGIEVMPPPLSAKRSMKSEDSPTTSPATASNWNSPNDLAGSPAGSNMTDQDTYSMPHSQPPRFAPPPQHAGMQPMPQPPPPQPQPMYAVGPPPPQHGGMPMQPRPPQQHHPQQQHRRNISDIAGGPEMVDAKRQQMYAAGPPMGPMVQVIGGPPGHPPPPR